MLPKRQRLNLNLPENRSIFRQKKIEGNFLKLYSRRSTNNEFKFGVSVPKRVVAKATDRNKVKRVVYSILESHAIKNKNIEILIIIIKNYQEPKEKHLFVEEYKLFLDGLENDF